MEMEARKNQAIYLAEKLINCWNNPHMFLLNSITGNLKKKDQITAIKFDIRMNSGKVQVFDGRPELVIRLFPSGC